MIWHIVNFVHFSLFQHNSTAQIGSDVRFRVCECRTAGWKSECIRKVSVRLDVDFLGPKVGTQIPHRNACPSRSLPNININIPSYSRISPNDALWRLMSKKTNPIECSDNFFHTLHHILFSLIHSFIHLSASEGFDYSGIQKRIVCTWFKLLIQVISKKILLSCIPQALEIIFTKYLNSTLSVGIWSSLYLQHYFYNPPPTGCDYGLASRTYVYAMVKENPLSLSETGPRTSIQQPVALLTQLLYGSISY